MISSEIGVEIWWGQKRKNTKKGVAINRWSNGAFLRRGLKRGFMSMMKGVIDEGGRAESGQKRILKESNFWLKKRALFPISRKSRNVA